MSEPFSKKVELAMIFKEALDLADHCNYDRPSLYALHDVEDARGRIVIDTAAVAILGLEQ